MKNTKKENRKHIRNFVVIIFTLVIAIITYISFRGEYLQLLEIGENYTSVFWKNMQYKLITTFVLFIIIYISFYITNIRIRKGLKSFFDDENRPVPKLVNKSVCFIISMAASLILSNFILDKVILFFNSTSFGPGSTDPIFGHDIGYYLFEQPFIEWIILFALILVVVLTIYAAIYYITVLNTCFNGVKTETLKNGKIVSQLLNNAKIFSILLAVFVFLTTQDLSSNTFLTIGEETKHSLYGAGFTDVNIKVWGYRILSIIIVISVFLAVSAYKKGKTKKVLKLILTVPGYLIILGLVMFGYNYLFVETNELDKQKDYINNNIQFTKKAYNIDIEQQGIENGGTITDAIIGENTNLLENISVANDELVLKYLNGTLTNKGYYKYSSTQVGIYEIDGEEVLVYITPREILNNSTTYDNKTYEYTHGYGIVITSASDINKNGTLEILQKSTTNEETEKVHVEEPRIYFGLETNETVVTNSPSKEEFDYISTDGNGIIATNSYTGEAGLQLRTLDRIVLALSQGNIKFAVSSDVNSNSKILTNRNVIERAKTVMPHLLYDENPYLVVRENGKLVWVLDAYTVSNEYPYSQKTTISDGYLNKQEINYIRNSVKVLIDAYDGTVDFYITDRTDPIVMAYRNAYPKLFKDLEEEIPQDISKHFIYPEYLYNIQANMIKLYHDVSSDVLYRTSDIWNIATYNSGISNEASIIPVAPYYTVLNTPDEQENTLGLVLPYTMQGKQNIVSYLVGAYKNGQPSLKIYTFPADSNILGTMQLDTQIEQNEKIYAEISSLNVTGTKITKNASIIPIDNTLLYVESIYQQYINETDSLPMLKKVVVASGNKVAIGDNFKEALINLASQYAINIEITETDNVEDLIKLIIKANKNLEESTENNDWEMMGKDLETLKDLINKLELVTEQEEQQVDE